MQHALPGVAADSPSQQRLPALRIRPVGKEQLGVRYQQVGSPQRFHMMLQRLRLEFPLATCQHLDGQPWWIIAASQRDQVQEFCRRNGLLLIEE